MKTVLITGCSSGYGLQTAHHFHAHGWNVIATMRAPREDILPRSGRLQAVRNEHVRRHGNDPIRDPSNARAPVRRDRQRDLERDTRPHAAGSRLYREQAGH